MSKIAKLLPSLALALLVFSWNSATSQTAPPSGPPPENTSTTSSQTSTRSNSSNDQSPQASSQSEAAKPENQADDSSAKTFDKNDQDDSAKDKKSKRIHFHLGTISLGAGYTHFSNNFPPYYGFGFFPYGGFYSPLAYGFYDPFYSGFYPVSYLYPSVYPLNFDYRPDKGEVKLTSSEKDAQVYLNGGFAGPADKLKSMWLEPGAYDLAVSGPKGEKFQQRIYVISGKSLEIQAKLTAQANSRPEEKQQ